VILLCYLITVVLNGFFTDWSENEYQSQQSSFEDKTIKNTLNWNFTD